MSNEMVQLFREHTRDDIERFEAIDKKLDAILLRLNPIDKTYVFTGQLWKLFLGFLGFLGLLSGIVVAIPAIWHLFFPPKL